MSQEGLDWAWATAAARTTPPRMPPAEQGREEVAVVSVEDATTPTIVTWPLVNSDDATSAMRVRELVEGAYTVPTPLLFEVRASQAPMLPLSGPVEEPDLSLEQGMVKGPESSMKPLNVLLYDSCKVGCGLDFFGLRVDPFYEFNGCNGPPVRFHSGRNAR